LFDEKKYLKMLRVEVVGAEVVVVGVIRKPLKKLNVFKYLPMILSKLFGSNCRAKILEKFFIEHSVS